MSDADSLETTTVPSPSSAIPDALQTLTVADVARILRLSVKTTGDLIRKGDLPALRVGGVWRIRASSLEEWLAQKEQSGAGRQPENTVESLL